MLNLIYCVVEGEGEGWDGNEEKDFAMYLVLKDKNLYTRLMGGIFFFFFSYFLIFKAWGFK